MQEDLPSVTSREQRMKDEPVAFDACESHEKEIDNVERVVDPVPECAEYVAAWVDTRGVQVSLGERQSNGEK